MFKNYQRKQSFGPIAVVAAVAIFGLLSLVIVDHGPWNRPQVQSLEFARSTTTGDAAQAAGAKVTTTEPKPALEPEAPGPKPAQPPNPVPSKN
jgi:hypothetical protein